MIDSHGFGRVVIDGKRYTSDVIIYPDRVDAAWWRESGHRLSLADIGEPLDEKPATLIIGTGSLGIMKVPEDVLRAVEGKGIRPLVMKTGAACEEYNRLCGKEKVICCLHLTC